MNPIIKILIFSDFFLFFGFGLINPIFAIFIKDNLQGGTLAAVGISAAVYLLVKAIAQIPIARFTDREPANVREFWTMMAGQFILVCIPFLYLIIGNIHQLYAVQALHGLGAALAFPGFMAIFTKFGDHKKAAFSWSVHSTTILLSTAASAGIGGYFGERYGFTPLFVGVGILAFLAFFTMLALGLFYKDLRALRTPDVQPFFARIAEFLGKSKQPPPPVPFGGGSLPK